MNNLQKSYLSSPWLTLIRNVSAVEFNIGRSFSVVTNGNIFNVILKIQKNLADFLFLIELSEIVYRVCMLIGEDSNVSLLSIVKAIFSRKCVHLDLEYTFFTNSDLESLLSVSEGFIDNL